ncbi:MAG TPA: hypothetical protein VFX01_08065 [Methylophilaceae bacterium]|nr:hypothetical protein [Methylophilaceae bacterium]
MDDLTYSQRLSLLYGISIAESGGNEPSTELADYDALEAASYLACALTFNAIRHAERSPADERLENFDMLSVYQAFAMLIYAYLTLPLGREGIAPDVEGSPVVIARTLFAGLENEEWAEIIESGTRKFQLIAGAEQEHWTTYREDLDKAVVAYVIAGTDDSTPFDKEEVIPMLGALLSMLCEAFDSD